MPSLDFWCQFQSRNLMALLVRFFPSCLAWPNRWPKFWLPQPSCVPNCVPNCVTKFNCVPKCVPKFLAGLPNCVPKYLACVPNNGPIFFKKQFFTWATIRRTFGRTIRRTIWRTILRFWRSISAHDLGARFGRTIQAHGSGARFGRTLWGAFRPSMRRFVLHCLGFFLLAT